MDSIDTTIGRRVGVLLAAAVAALTMSAPQAQDMVTIEKLTNGQDADAPPGPALIVGDPVSWSYVVTNSGGRTIVNIEVTDDQGVAVTCPATTLGAGLSMTCTGSGTVFAGQYANIGTVTAEDSIGTPLTDSEPSHYLGQAAVAVDLEKSTEGVDADTAPGPVLPVGSTVNWTYEVTNVGADPLTNITVTDDQGVAVSCPATDLAVGASMTCTGSGTVQPGQYANLGAATAELPSTDVVADSDPSHHFGQTLLLEKLTNGVDADVPPGPTLMPGSAVTWTYEVENPGPADVTDVSVTDDQGVVVSCPGTTLAAGASMTCSGSGTAQVGQYANIGTASGTLPLGGVIVTTDPSHYFGSIISLQKSTNGQDADTSPGPTVLAGDPVSWTYEVTNNGSEPIDSIVVTDDQGVSVTCPGTTLAAGESMTCTGSGTAVAGQYSNVGAVEGMITGGSVTASDPSHYFGEIPQPAVAATKTDALLIDDGDGQAGAGDTLRYTVVITNSGNGSADAVLFADNPDANTALVVGSVTTSQGTVTTGNGGGDTLVAVDVGTIAASGGSATITFDVLIDDPLPVGVTQVGNQGDVSGSNFTTVATDDPDQAGAADPTVTALANAPDVAATKTAVLQDDVDGNGASAGDTLRYTVTLDNTGTGTASAVAFADTPGANTALVAGSVTTSQGTVIAGNGGGDTSVSVDIGDVLAGTTVTIVFDVLIADPLPSGVSSVSNQGSVSGGTIATVATDDPAVAGSADPTVTPVLNAPGVSASKTAVLQDDVDRDGASAGDTLRYTVTIDNGGTGTAEAVAFADTPGANTALVAGSVTTSQGTVAGGNGGGDTSVSVDIGDVLAGSTVTVVFDVLIADPLPPGVTSVSNQGSVSGGNITTVVTDDPAAPGSADPTVTPLVNAPVLSASKTVALGVEVANDGQADRGDTLAYTIVVSNDGMGDAAGVVVADPLDPNVQLVVGSVGTTQGSVTTGNTPGDTGVVVDVGTLAAGASATITFDARIDSATPDTVTQITNQGQVTSSNAASVATDDPGVAGASDPTVIALSEASPSALAQPSVIPTLGRAMMLMLALGLALFGGAILLRRGAG